MAFLHCKVCGWAGNGMRQCPDCGPLTIVSDEVEDMVPIEIVVVDTEGEVENE